MANLVNPAAHVLDLGTNQASYEANAIAPNSKRAENLRNMRNNLIPQFTAFQVNAEGHAANGLAFYNATFPGQVFGGLLGCFIHWIHFRR
jgi:hypothetical protein